jgi:glutamate carboxypeptidase
MENRGVGRYTIECKGMASHTGVAPEKGISAINELAYWIIGLHGMTNYEKGTNVNVGVIKGGTTANTVADEAVALVDVRMREMSEIVKIEKTIQEMLANPQTPGIKVTVKEVDRRLMSWLVPILLQVIMISALILMKTHWLWGLWAV